MIVLFVLDDKYNIRRTCIGKKRTFYPISMHLLRKVSLKKQQIVKMRKINLY